MQVRIYVIGKFVLSIVFYGLFQNNILFQNHPAA
jgi:hypothetical protein